MMWVGVCLFPIVCWRNSRLSIFKMKSLKILCFLFLLLTLFQFSCQEHGEVDPEICLQVNENRAILVKVYGERGREMFNRYCPPHDADYYKSN